MAAWVDDAIHVKVEVVKLYIIRVRLSSIHWNLEIYPYVHINDNNIILVHVHMYVHVHVLHTCVHVHVHVCIDKVNV